MAARHPWNRRDGESTQAFEAFTTYLLLGPERSTAKVGLTLGKSKKLMDRWCKRDEWVLRVAAYEEHFALKMLDASEDERITMMRQHRELSTMALTKAVARLRVLVDQVPEFDDDGKPTDLREMEKNGEIATVDQALRLADLAVKVGRLATGLDGKYVPSDAGSTDISNLDEDDLDTLEALLEKARS